MGYVFAGSRSVTIDKSPDICANITTSMYSLITTGPSFDKLYGVFKHFRIITRIVRLIYRRFF